MKTRLALPLALLLACAGAAFAEDSVCNTETGAAYGLCNAYCDAMDCDGDSPSASATACSKVRNKFQQIAGRDLPCEAPVVACPCNNPALDPVFAGIVTGQIPVTSCQTPPVFPFPSIGIVINQGGQEARAGQDFLGASGCGVAPNDRLASPEETQVCMQLLQQAATRDGVTCVQGTDEF